MGQQPSTAGKTRKKPKKVSTDSSKLYDDDDDRYYNSSKNRQTENKSNNKDGQLQPPKAVNGKASQTPSPKHNNNNKTPSPKTDKQQSPTPPITAAANNHNNAAVFTPDDSNPFCGPLDHLREEERPYYHLASISHFDVPTLRKLHQIFIDISESGIDDGCIDANELTDAMGLDKECLLARAIFRIFDITQTKKINFRTWITTLSALSDKATLEEKIKFSFNLYDLNDDGTIDVNELRTLLAAAVRENVLNLSEEQVQAVCDHTLQNVDRDGDGMVDYDEYRAVVSKSHKFITSFTLDIPTLVQSFRIQRGNRGGSTENSASNSQNQSRDNSRLGQHDSNGANNNTDGLTAEEQLMKQRLFKSREKKQHHSDSESAENSSIQTGTENTGSQLIQTTHPIT